MSVSLPLLRAALPEGAPRWVLSIEGRHFEAPLPDRDPEAYALATLNNALCTFTPARIASYVSDDARPVVETAIRALSEGGTSVLLDLCRHVHELDQVALPVAPLARLAPAHPAPPVSVPPRPARSDACVLGVDVGGTDIKLVALAGDHVLAASQPAWQVPLRELEQGQDFVRALTDPIDDLLAEVGLPIAGIGVSWPDIVVNGAIVGGMTSKTAGMRARHGGFTRAYRDDFERHIRPLARKLAKAYGVPAVVVNDGPAAAIYAARALGRPGILCLSLGTSVAGGLVGRHGTPLALPAYTSGLVVRLGAPAATAHRTTGLRGVAQQLPTQAGAFRLAAGLELPDLPPRERLQALLGHGGAHAVLRELGEGLADTIDEARFWLRGHGVDDVVVFGRLVGDPEAAKVILDAANDRVDVDVIPASALGRPWDLDPEVFGQALGAALLASDRG